MRLDWLGDWGGKMQKVKHEAWERGKVVLRLGVKLTNPDVIVKIEAANVANKAILKMMGDS